MDRALNGFGWHRHPIRASRFAAPAGRQAGVDEVTAYSWIKVVHLLAIAVWMGGMLANDLALLALPDGGPPPALRAMRRWDRVVTTPAMLATWAAGITIAMWAGWWHEGWLWTKVALVLALSALHGLQSATLRRLGDGWRPPLWMRFSPLAVVGALPIIATLAVAKPF